MSIVYVRLEVAVHGLNFESEPEMESYRLRIKRLIDEHHPAGYLNIMDGDVEVEITEHAGGAVAELGAHRTKVDCGTCANKGRIDGLSQETHCDHCTWQEQWRTDHYVRNAT